MNVPENKIYIPGPRPGELIECSPQDLREYGECLKSKLMPSLTLTVLASSAIAVATPIASQASTKLKRIGIGLGCFFIGQAFSTLYCKSSCAPYLQRLIQSKIALNTEQAQNKDTPDETNEILSSDFTPLEFNDVDMPPSSFSLDPGFKIYSIDEEKDVRKMTEKPPVTYEELRMKSREQFKPRIYGTPKPQTGFPDKKEENDDEWNSSAKTWPRKTNIYGDVLE